MGLSSTNKNPIIVVDFKYAAIIPERWDNKIFFVQDMKSGLWGALSLDLISSNIQKGKLEHTVNGVVELMPPIAEDIFEDFFYTDCAPTVFWMLKKGNKIGVLTNWGYTEILYDAYETDDENCIFILNKNGGKESIRVSIIDISGKTL